MPKHKIADKAEIYLCSEDHFHIELTDELGNEMAGIALDFDEGLEMLQAVLDQVEQRTGLMFVVIDPDDLDEDDEDPIGPVMGSC